MANKKFLDYDGLIKFKSLLDETYMKNGLNMDLGDFSGTLEQILQGIVSNINNNSNIINTHTSNTVIHVPTIENASYSNYILTRDKTNTTPNWSPGVVVPFESGTDKIFMNLTANSPTWENISTLVSKLPLATGYVKLSNNNAEFTETQIGLVSTTYQSFSGEKQFNNGIRLLSGSDTCTTNYDEESGSGVCITSPEIYFGKNYNCKIYRGCPSECIESGLNIINTHPDDGSINFITLDNKKWGILGTAPKGIPVFHNNLHINPDYNSSPTSYSSGICIYENKYYNNENEGWSLCSYDRSQGFIGYNERTNIDDTSVFAPFVMETDVSDIELITPGKINLKTAGGLFINDNEVSVQPASGCHMPHPIYNGLVSQEKSAGILTTEQQSIAGEKVFNDGIRLVNLLVDCAERYKLYGYGGGLGDSLKQYATDHECTIQPRIHFGNYNTTFIGQGHNYNCPDAYSNYAWAENAFLDIKSPGFNNILIDDYKFDIYGGLSKICKLTQTSFTSTSLLYNNIISLNSGNSTSLTAVIGYLSSSGATNTFSNCSIGTLKPTSGIKNITGLIGGEVLTVSLTDVKYSFGVCLSNASNGAPYSINSGTFSCTTAIYYRFKTSEEWKILSVTFSGSIANKGLSSPSNGNPTKVTLTPSSTSQFSISVPDDATSMEYCVIPFAPNTLLSEPTGHTSITIVCSNIEIYYKQLAYSIGYNYLKIGYSNDVGCVLGTVNYGSITATKSSNLSFVGSEYTENLIFGNGISCITYNLGSNIATDFGYNNYDSYYRSAILLGDKSLNNRATESAAFSVLEPTKLYMHSNIGQTMFSSLGIHRCVYSSDGYGKIASKYNYGRDLYITTSTYGGDIVFANANINDPIDDFIEIYEGALEDYFSGGAILRPHYDAYGSIGTSNHRWGLVYGNNGYFNNVTVSSLCQSKVFAQTSDAKLKNIKDNINVDLERLKEIPKIYFNYKDDNIDNKRIGTIAQDVQKIYPEIVHEAEDGYLTLEYDKLSVIALKGIDELYENQKRLESEIKELKSLILKYIEQ